MKKDIINNEPEIKVTVVSSNIVLLDFYDTPEFSVDKYVGRMKEGSFRLKQKEKIKDDRIQQFMFINVDFNTAFNYKQVRKLSDEIAILEEADLLNKEILEVLNKGIDMVLNDKDLYLKFEYDA